MNIPDNVVGLISLKTRIKKKGIVNVSGFHVDPGFKGRLKFWIYNAGNKDISLLRGDKVFLIWFSDLDGATSDPYPNKPYQNELSSDDIMELQGRVASPVALARKLDIVTHEVKVLTIIVRTLIVFVISFGIAVYTPLIERLYSYLSSKKPKVVVAASPAPSPQPNLP